MKPTDQRLEQLADRARAAAQPATADLPFGFATRVLAATRSQGDAAVLWVRFSLASLPLAALAAAACIHWLGIDVENDAHDLAQVFVQYRFLP